MVSIEEARAAMQQFAAELHANASHIAKALNEPAQPCPDECPDCGFDLKSDGYPIGHQDPEGAACAFEWDYQLQRDVERAEDAWDGCASRNPGHKHCKHGHTTDCPDPGECELLPAADTNGATTS